MKAKPDAIKREYSRRKRRRFNPNKVRLEGQKASAGSKCPFSEGQIGERCSWLAGHYDKHGLEAWEAARQY